MPRDGSGVYDVPPGTQATPNTTILSAAYNAFLADIVADLNAARPVSAGGTGGTSVITGWDGLAKKGTDIADGATINLTTATGPSITMLGTTTLTGVTLAEGSFRLVRAAAAKTITASANLLVNGSAVTPMNVAAEDLLVFRGGAAGVVSVARIGSASVAAATTSAAGIVEQQFAANYNLGIACSVGASALTIALKDAEGNDPSSSSPVIIPFRNVTAATGTPSYLTVTAATSLVISSGSTMGFASGVMGRLWIVGFNDGGTFRLGAINVRNGLSIMALAASGIASSTAEGGAGGADSPHVFYTGTAVASKAYTVLGYLDATEATAGTWATAPSLVTLFSSNIKLPGEVIGRWTSIDGTTATGATTTPLDDTIPQNTEGNQFMSLAVTLNSLANLVKATHRAIYTSASAVYITAAIHENAVANAKGAGVSSTAGANQPFQVSVDFVGLAATTTPTYTVRAGGSGASTVRFNGYNGAQVFGGAANGILEVWEIMS